MRMVMIVPFLLLLAAAQRAPSTPQSGPMAAAPLSPALKPPPVTLQKALRIAEKYVAQNKVDIQKYWLQEVTLVVPMNATRSAGSHWSLFWNNLRGAKGDYVEIEVDMNGQAKIRPTE